MQITNRDLALMAASAFVVMAAAVLLTASRMSRPEPTAPLSPDLVTVRPEVQRTGGSRLDPRGPLTVRLTRPGEHVLVTCDLFKAQRSVTGGAATFSTLPVGDCALSVDGARPYGPVYPGDVLRCGVGEGVTRCTGGLATSRAATVAITSDAPAELFVDGDAVGPLPVRTTMRVGQRELRIAYPDGRHARYRLVVEPDQQVKLSFPAPSGYEPEEAEAAPPAPRTPAIASRPIRASEPAQPIAAQAEAPEPAAPPRTGASTEPGSRTSALAPTLTTP